MWLFIFLVRIWILFWVSDVCCLCFVLFFNLILVILKIWIFIGFEVFIRVSVLVGFGIGVLLSMGIVIGLLILWEEMGGEILEDVLFIGKVCFFCRFILDWMIFCFNLINLCVCVLFLKVILCGMIFLLGGMICCFEWVFCLSWIFFFISILWVILFVKDISYYKLGYKCLFGGVMLIELFVKFKFFFGYFLFIMIE